MEKKKAVCLIIGLAIFAFVTGYLVVSFLNKGSDTKKQGFNWNFKEGNSGVLNLEISLDDEKNKNNGEVSIFLSNKDVDKNTNYKVSINEEKLPAGVSFEKSEESGKLSKGEEKTIDFNWKIDSNKYKEKSIIIEVLINGD